MPGGPQYDEYGGGAYGGGGGESVITLEEFQDLKRAIQTLVEAQASQRRGSRFKIDWKWYHIVFLILFNDLILIAVGTSIGSAFYNISPLAGGSFRAGPMEAENIAINPELGLAQQTIHSVDEEATLELRAHTSHAAKVSLGDIEAEDAHIYTMQTHTTPGEYPSWMLMEGFDNRMAIESYHNRSDIVLSPTLSGKVFVNDDLSLAKSRIGTEHSDLVVAPGHGHDLHLAPSINAKVTVHKDMTMQGGAIGTTFSNLALSAAQFRNVSITVQNASVDITGQVAVTGDSKFDGSLHVRDEISGAHITSYTNADFRGDVLFGDDPTDALDFKGHFRSCVGAHPGIAGTLGADDGSCEHSTMIFDADDNGAFFAVGVPNTVGPTTHHLVNFESDAMCSKAGRPPNFRRNGEPASWIEKPCMVLTTESQDSMLQGVGDLSKGNIVSGFGTAEVSGLTSRGASNLYGDVTVGISLQNEVSVNGHITSNRLVFDRDSDGVRYILTFPDPSTDDFQERVVDFPMETGTVLTSASSFSTLEAVGALSQGSLVTGFGSAEVSSLLSTGFSHLSRDLQLGTTSSDEIEISGHVTSPRMVFDANSDGTTVTFEYPDPILVSKTISFPDESGRVLTTASDFSTLTAVDELVQGSIGPGFGSAHVASLTSDGNTNLLSNIVLGHAVTDQMSIRAHVISSTMIFDANSDGVNKLTVFYPDPAQPRTILFPEEDGVLLTTTSTMSRLNEVGELAVGSIVEGFGDAAVTGLSTSATANINADMVIGDEITDSVSFNSRIANAELVVNHPTADGDLTIQFPRPANDITISFAPLTGEVLTDVSTFSVLTTVADLSSGQIVEGFGDITTANDIATTNLGEITADGKLTARSSAQLGSVPEHEITIRGTVEVRGGATTVFSIDPADGNTFVNGNLEVGGSIEALAAPFYVNAINTGSITELIDDAGVVIEGIVFKDGGFEMAKTDQIDEYTEGQGVNIDGVLMRDGGVIAEAALVSTNPRGSIDLVTLINNGRDYEMIGTLSNLKFRQYFQATPDEGSFAVDSGAITVGTETNWNEDPLSRSAYMSFSTVHESNTIERVHISANGDYAVNVDQLTITEATADVKIKGNTTIGEGQTGEKRLLLNSDDSDVFFDMTAGGGAFANVYAGAGEEGAFSVTSDTKAKLRLVNPSLAPDGIFEIIQLGGAPVQTLVISDGADNLVSIMVDADGVRGNVEITGHTDSNSVRVATLLESEDMAIYGNSTLGDSLNDTVTLLGHLTNENVTFDHSSDKENTVTLYLPEPTQSRVIEFPDEDGRVLTTTSNYSTLTEVATLVVGNLGDGFGYADVAELNSKGITTLLSDIDLGDGIVQDGVNINAHIRESVVAYDANSDTNNITLEIPDPTPPIPLFERRCSTWDGTIVPVTIGWPYDDVRKIDWTNVSETFPVPTSEREMLIIYNITEERDYSWINCAYNSTIFANKTEVPDSSDYSCADYHAVGYTCNDLVFIFGYDCKATCVTPTLEDDIGIDTGYGWLSLEQALIDHRDMVKDLIDSAPSYTVSLPEETGTVVLTQCEGDSKTPGKCVTRLPAGGGKCKTPAGDVVANVITQAVCELDPDNTWTDGFGDIYLGSTEDDTIYIPGMIKGFFTVLGTILTSNPGSWPNLPWTVESAMDRTGLRVDKTEGLRFKQDRTTSSTMHLTIANQTSDQWLALPDETGYLLSSSSTFSTLNTLGVLTGLEVGGTCTNPAGVVVDAGKEACDLVAANTWTDGDALFRGDVALGDQPEDTLTISSALVSSENLACETEDVCTGTALDPATDTPDVPATCTGTVGSGHPDNGNACDAAGGAWDTAATKLAADCPTGFGCTYVPLDPGTCSMYFLATRAMPFAILDAADCPAGCSYRAKSIDITGANPTADELACEAFTCSYTAFAAPTCKARDEDACAAMDGYGTADDPTCTPGVGGGGTCDPCSTYDPHGTGGGVCNWDGTAAAGLRCVAVDKADCDTEDAAINAALPYSETVTVSASDHADTEAADSASCAATGSVGGGCAYTSGVQEACAAQPDSDVALIFDGMTTGDGKVINLALVEPTGSNTLTFPDETGKVLTDVSTFSRLESVGPLSVGTIVGGVCSDPRQITEDECVTQGGSCSNPTGDASQGTCAGLAPAGTWTMATWTRGFGSARVESLTVDGRGDATKLNGDTNIGDGLGDDILVIKSTITGKESADPTVFSFTGNTCSGTTTAPYVHTLTDGTTTTDCATIFGDQVTKARLDCEMPGVAGCTFEENGPYRLSLAVTGQTADHTITLPGTIGGTLLTDETRFGAILEEVGPLKVGSLVGGSCDVAVPVADRTGGASASHIAGFTEWVTEADCTTAGGTWTDGFGDAHVDSLVVSEHAILASHVVLGSSQEDYIRFNGRIKNTQLTFDDSGIYGSAGTVTLQMTMPADGSHHMISFPPQTGNILLSTSTQSLLEGVGQLSTGSIVEGFGTIRTDNDISTACDGVSGVCPTITSAGPLKVLEATVFSTDGFPYDGSAPMTIPPDKSTIRVTPDGLDRPISFEFSVQADGVEPGQMLVIHNNEDASGTPNNLQHASGAVRDIWPGVAATYFYLGTRWVQTGWICDKAPGDFCTDSLNPGVTIPGGHSAP